MERLDVCASDLRASLEPDERLIAVGRCEDVTETGSIDAGGAGWTFVMVTSGRLRWVPHSLPRFEANVDLDEVTSALEMTSAHRYAITLRHPAVRALRTVPARRFLWFQWGYAEALRTLRSTTLAFSRRDTKASRALREQLALRGVVTRVVPSPPRPPREPNPYLVALRPDDQ
jgi:hypothetical protein